MRVDTMRFIDRWLGIPCCFLLTLCVQVIALFRIPGKTTPQRVLLLELSEMGSTILADPAMRKLRDERQCELFFAIFEKNRASLDLLGTVPATQVFTLRETGLLPLAADTLRFFFWTRRQQIDTVLDLELFSRFTALLSGLSGAVNRVGFHSFHNEGLYRGALLTHRVWYNPHIHIAKNFLALVHAVCSEQPEVPYAKTLIRDEDITLPTVTASEESLAAIQAIIANRAPFYRQADHRLVLINPNASELLPQRRWMPARYEELIHKILAIQEDILVLVTGAPGEHKEAQALCQRIGNKRCVNFTGATSLAQLPALYNLAELMVTNDSGPGHFSSVTDLPTFVLFGPETPALYGSLGEQATPIYAGLACSPCVSAANHRKTPCTDNKCLQAITVDQVFAMVSPLLQKGTTGSSGQHP